MDNYQLTKSQLSFYDFITGYYKEQRIWPTYATIKEHFGFKSDNSVHRRLKALVRKGYLSKSEQNGYQLTNKVPGRIPSAHAEVNVVTEPEGGKSDE